MTSCLAVGALSPVLSVSLSTSWQSVQHKSVERLSSRQTGHIKVAIRTIVHADKAERVFINCLCQLYAVNPMTWMLADVSGVIKSISLMAQCSCSITWTMVGIEVHKSGSFVAGLWRLADSSWTSSIAERCFVLGSFSQSPGQHNIADVNIVFDKTRPGTCLRCCQKVVRARITNSTYHTIYQQLTQMVH